MKYYALLDSETKKMAQYFRCDDNLQSGHAMLTEDGNNWISVPAPVDLTKVEDQGNTYEWLEDWQIQAILMSLNS